MRVPLSWLAEYVESLPDAIEVAERLTMAGIEAEEIRMPHQALASKLIVVRIRAVRDHPNADRLHLCEIDDGGAGRRVVCGASNMQAGDLVVLALPGAILPDGKEIKEARIRGQVSQGMLCSAAELGLADDHSGIMILDKTECVGRSAAALLGLDDHVLELTVTPNRGDCLSIRGLAREVAAVCGLRLSARFHERPEPPAGSCRVAVQIDSPEDCLLYCGMEVRGVRIGPSPTWLMSRLSACGLRPLNIVVDVTNWVLLELGQPLHAFDCDRIGGPRIAVRSTQKPTDIQTLDGQSRRLEQGDLVIWDADGPAAIAGVMGAARTAVQAGTSNLFLESALFAPAAVRRTARRLGLSSEASYRFERGVDPACVEEALLWAARRIVTLAGGKVAGGIVRAGAKPKPPAGLELRPERIEGVLGVGVSVPKATEILSSLGLQTRVGGGKINVVVPSHRHDLTREIDLIEEIARIRGYETIVSEAPRLALVDTCAPDLGRLHKQIRWRLAACGFTEIVGLAFCSEQANALFPGLHGTGRSSLRLRNPLSSDATEMRKSLIPTLLRAHEHNVRNQTTRTDFFTLGRCFATGSDRHVEKESVAGLLWGPRHARGPGYDGPATFWDAKSAVEGIAGLVCPREALEWVPCDERPEYHPRETARVRLAGRCCGYLGRLHPSITANMKIPQQIYIFELDTRSLVEYASRARLMRPIPRYPAASRDVSLLVAEQVLAGQVIAEVEAVGEPLLERVVVFDEYVGEGMEPGYKALAFTFVYRSPRETLTDEEIEKLHARLVSHLCERLAASVRA